MRKITRRTGSGAHQALRPSDAAPATSRRDASETGERLAEPAPAAWLDQLLAVSIDLPLASGEASVVTALVDALAAMLPDHAVGACFVPEPGSRSRGQLVVRRLPAAMAEPPAGIDPTRVFPGMAHEHVAPLPGSTTGSTLNVASERDGLASGHSPVVHLLDRAAAVLGRALQHARRLGLPAEAPKDVDDRMIQVDKLATFGQIAAGIVHELNNPLTSIVAYSDYLMRRTVVGGAPQDPDDIERLRRINESANRMLRFTRDFVTYARPSSGAAAPVVLHDLIDQAVAFCEHVLAGAAVSVERRYAPDVLAVRGVGEQLVQVFVNLLTNASHAAPPRGGRIVVTTRLEAASRRVVVAVEDNGSGIEAAYLARVFVPFFTTKAERQGTGLGLSIVKSIVDAHDGDVRAESEPGRGARFVLTLPTWSKG